jgi:hypothetical protein
MWTGKRFILRNKILAIRVVDKIRQAEYIPKGEVLEVIGGPRPNAVHLVDVHWNACEYKVFASDVEEAAEEIIN